MWDAARQAHVVHVSLAFTWQPAAVATEADGNSRSILLLADETNMALWVDARHAHTPQATVSFLPPPSPAPSPSQCGLCPPRLCAHL